MGEWGRLWKKDKVQESGDPRGSLKEKLAVGEQKIKANIQAERGPGTAEEGKKNTSPCRYHLQGHRVASHLGE